jgi:protein-S-isoprenylcysteine O-methyltransferase Ste14
MLPQIFTVCLLALPLVVLILVSILYWLRYGRQEKQGSDKQHIDYNKFFLTLVAIGYFSIWIFWLGGIVLLCMDQYFSVLVALTYPLMQTAFLQIIGFVVFYIGTLFFAWAVGFAGKSLRPSTSDVYTDHKLVQDGPLGIVRHPYYVSYVLILVGLSLVLSTLWALLPALCVVIGMGPTAAAEEKELTALFGEQYLKYQRRVGRFFPRLFKPA